MSAGCPAASLTRGAPLEGGHALVERHEGIDSRRHIAEVFAVLEDIFAVSADVFAVSADIRAVLADRGLENSVPRLAVPIDHVDLRLEGLARGFDRLDRRTVLRAYVFE